MPIRPFEHDSQEEKIHINAATLIVAAAEKSGLLREVAEALCYFNQQSRPTADCPACALRDVLADLFDDHICTPGEVIEAFYGEGVCPSPLSDAELAPYLKVEA
jgi:hypothetical protein